MRPGRSISQLLSSRPHTRLFMWISARVCCIVHNGKMANAKGNTKEATKTKGSQERRLATRTCIATSSAAIELHAHIYLYNTATNLGEALELTLLTALRNITARLLGWSCDFQNTNPFSDLDFFLQLQHFKTSTSHHKASLPLVFNQGASIASSRLELTAFTRYLSIHSSCASSPLPRRRHSRSFKVGRQQPA